MCSGRTISLFNLISQQPDTKTICFYNLFKDPCEAKFKLEKYNPNKKRKILIVFDNIIADMLTNKKFNLVLTELFIRGRKLNISLIFIIQSYFSLPKILDSMLHTFLLRNFQTNKNFNKLHLIIHQILNLQTL